MTEETTIKTGGEEGTSVTTGTPVPRSTNEYILYKLDRSFAILGIIAIAIVAIFTYKPDLGVTVATGAISGLVGYVGGRTGK